MRLKIYSILALLLAIALFSFKLLQEEAATVFVIGDSTASDYGSSSYPRTGWGTSLELFFDSDQVAVDNRALSGRSSKSFYHESGAWNKTIADISEGDYLIIQFGHNDAKSDEERHTDPYTTYQEYLKKYIDEARAKGANPVLATSIHRNYWSGTSIKDSHGDYPPAMRALAEEENVPLLDLHVKTKDLFESLGEAYTTTKVFMNLEPGEYPNYPNGDDDDTHLQENGAIKVARLSVEEIGRLASSFDELQILDGAIRDIGYVQVEINNESYGAVSGDGYNTLNDSASLTASAKVGYALKEWQIDGEVVGQDRNLKFLVDQDTVTVTAIFDVGYRVILQREPSNGGSISGSGSYVEGASVALTAEPSEDFYFVGWMIDEELISSENPYTFNMPAENMTIQAKFSDQPLLSNHNMNDDVKVFIHNRKLQVSGDVEISELHMIDVSGRLISKFKSIDNLNESIESWPSGVYITRLVMKSGQHKTMRVIIED